MTDPIVRIVAIVTPSWFSVAGLVCSVATVALLLRSWRADRNTTRRLEALEAEVFASETEEP
jgi:hypothetical protein